MSDGSGSESEEEFVLPPGFESVSGGVVSKDSLMDKELWFFRLPKDMDASALNGVTFKLPKDQNAEIEVPVDVDGLKKFKLKSNDSHLYSQVVNLVPDKKKSQTYVPGKPFARSFSLVETINVPKKHPAVEEPVQDNDVVDPSPAKKKKKSKKQ
ncbi:Aste57867_13570 [Aphanomyces stellatus]|uniref:Aste57867_13570 protein n=1 Tax=Aphanomyces stellatus TaxID=120398 RepID=A0A485KYT6_9STRA|nr:hypothetical protein As57867_013520 [Aphanomyces stellatus]VFT90408.1 Aste57867_13570 [Aphanomyces stellatus]